MAKSISILNKIQNKPILMQNIFPFILKRPTILIHLISEDNKLKTQLNNIFSGVKKKKNKLEKELINNLILYSFLREIVYKLYRWYYKINELIINEELFNNTDFDLTTNLYDKLVDFLEENTKYSNILTNKNILKSIVLDFLSSLDNIPIFYNYIIMNNDYFKYIEDTSKKMKKKINLVLLIDEKDFSNNFIPDIIKVNEIEIIKTRYKSYDDIFLYLNQFFYNKEKIIKNVNKIFFHNETYANYLNENYDKIISNEKYQCLLNFIFDRYYLKGNEYTKCLFKIFQNLKEIKIENLELLYKYEQFKIYNYIIDLIPKLPIINNERIYYKEDKIINITYYIINKNMIINVKNKEKKIIDLINYINLLLNKTKNIEYLFIVNNSKLLFEENLNNIGGKIELNIKINNLKEFMIINNLYEIDNNLDLIKKYIVLNIEKNKYKYEGYNKNNNLIYYREGFTHLQSFDLIELFKNNKSLFNIKLIKEKINIIYTTNRTYLEIKNIEEKKDENTLPLRHFTQFIFNQKNLKELVINKFDYSIQDLTNKNVNKISINYEKNLLIKEYSIIDDKSIFKFNNLLPSLSLLNIGGDYKWISYFSYNNVPKSVKEINIITVNNNLFKENEKIKNKYSKFGIKITFEYINI